MVIKVCITIIAFVVTINNGQIGLFREVYRRRPLYKILSILVFSFVASPILCYFCPKPFSLRSWRFSELEVEARAKKD